MPKGPVRRGQLIAPFGVGAMLIVRDGSSLITGGLDHWFESEELHGHPVDTDEFAVEEWRLQKELDVSHFRLPPDYRRFRGGVLTPNQEITIPTLRFPQYHFCATCHLLIERPLAGRESFRCPECQQKRKRRYLRQVQIIAMCEHGHLNDFPWRQWAHESEQVICNQSLRLYATGGSTLAAQIVKCDCGKQRSLAGATGASLTIHKGGGLPFSCRGKMPWHGKEAFEPCDQPLRGTLRSASNVYFAQVRSAIYLPRGTAAVPDELIERLGKVSVRSFIEIVEGAGGKVDPNVLRKKYPAAFDSFTTEQIVQGLAISRSGAGVIQAVGPVEGDDWVTGFRRAEYAVLQTARQDLDLHIRAQSTPAYGRAGPYFSRMMLVDKLRETRALIGFTRVNADSDRTPTQLQSLLWRQRPDQDPWLPAYVVFGEGIFLILDEERLQEWEASQAVIDRVSRLAQNYGRARSQRHLRERVLTPRFVMLHTLAHVLMNQLTFECGYSSASLRERLYVSANPAAPMAGLLIYTAAGDSEGTLGGLVRMGKPENFEAVLLRALEGATWCSADPVCMELGEHGQGPDSCNLAACHNCGLVPETACEEFNYFLDRAFLVGRLLDPGLGFFTYKEPSVLQTTEV